MRRLLFTLGFLLLARSIADAPAIGRIDSPQVSPGQVAADSQVRADEAMERGLDRERARNWAGAMEVYREALQQWPSRVEFGRRLRLCEIHFKLNRRYADPSFRNILLALAPERATELYEEVLERIQSNYVDSVAMEPLVRHGIDNLEVALRDPVFLRANHLDASAERINEVRETLRKYRTGLAIPDRPSALGMAMACADLAGKSLRLDLTPVLLEFTCGACDALDDFTSYLTPDKLEDLYAMIDGNFVGLGIELKSDNEGLRLVGVIRGGPAWEAGLLTGELIVQIDGITLKGMSLDDAANRLQGLEGSTVALVVRKRDGRSQSLRLVRRHVEVESVVKTKMVDPNAGIGYLRLTTFQKSSTEEIDAAIAAMSSRGMRVLVLDLRGNPGGLLNVAVDIAGRFVNEGTIVSTRGRAQGQTQSYLAAGKARWTMPMYVLVDHDSASASEILAGALQDHRRATIVGTRTYGKGSVQSIFSLRSAPAGLKLTTAKFYSPKDRPYSEQGVSPDLPIVSRSAARPTDDAARIREEADYGDPQHDPVLAATLRAARQRSGATP